MSLKYLTKFYVHLLHYAILMAILAFFLTTTLTATTGTTVSAAEKGSSRLVLINKCCPKGEILETNQTCVIGSSTKWVPSIFIPVRRKLYDPRGEAPPFMRFLENTKPINPKCTNLELITGDGSKFVLSANGSLYLTEKSLFINPNEYCVDKDTALVCFPEKVNNLNSLVASNKKFTKVRKCCTRELIYNRDNKTCDKLKNGLKHPINKFNFLNTTAVEIIYGFPHCTSTSYVLAGFFRSELLNNKYGNLTLDSGKELISESFCVEHTIGGDDGDIIDELHDNSITRIHSKDSILIPEALSTNPDDEKDSPNSDVDNHLHIFTCSEHFSQPPDFVPSVALDNSSEANADEQNLRFVLLAAGLLISVIFLIATLATGFLMPSNHHVLHWKCQSYYVGCLLIGDLLLAINQIAGISIIGGYCIAIAILMHFFFLAAFFWLNTMCFNIWWTFRDFRPTSLEKNQETLRLRIYSIYAWGVPLIIVSVGAILDFIPDGDNVLRPRFGEKKCWFYGDLEILTYFFGPIGILLFTNLLLFGSTARQLTCGLWKIDDVKSTTEKAALGRVCLKLVIVMGVTWIADIVSWMVGGHWYIWCITDLINALQGVFIFIVVGCQPQVWSAVKRIWTTKTGRGVTTNTNGPQHSSSSHGLPSIGETITNNTLTNTTSNTTSTKVPMETVC